jgi:hypothetical protein
MPIVTSITQVQETSQGTDGSHVVLRMFDQDNNEYTISFFTEPGTDIPALVALRTVDLNEQLANTEFETIINE